MPSPPLKIDHAHLALALTLGGHALNLARNLTPALTYLLPLPLLIYFPVTYLLSSSLYILCSIWPPKKGRAGSGSGPKPAVYHY